MVEMRACTYKDVGSYGLGGWTWRWSDAGTLAPCQTLVLSGQRLGDEEMFTLAEALRGNDKIEKLDLSSNPAISDKGVQALAAAFKDNTYVHDVNLAGTKLHQSGLLALLTTRLPLLTLNVSDTPATDPATTNETAAKVQWLIERGPSHQERINYMPSGRTKFQLGDGGAKLLAAALQGNTKLTSLNVVGNKLGPAAIASLADVLAEAPLLAECLMSNNPAGPQGWKTVAKLYSKMGNLSTLSIGSMNIADDSAEATKEILLKNPNLRHASFKNNKLGVKQATAIAEGLRGNNNIQDVDLYFNQLGDKGAAVLAEMLEGKQTSVVALDLRVNQIGDAGAKALAAALETDTQMTVLYLDYNTITDEGGLALLDALKTHPAMQELKITAGTHISAALAQKIVAAAAAEPVPKAAKTKRLRGADTAEAEEKGHIEM